MLQGSHRHRFRRWLAYEVDAHARVIESLRAVPGDRCSSPQFTRAVGLLAHLVQARRLWLFRLGGAAEGPGAGEFFPAGWPLDEVERRMVAVQQRWSEWLDRTEDPRLEESFEYTSLEGRRFRNRVEDVLTQLLGHSCHHRGQIADCLRAMGVEPPAADFVFWSREAL